MTFGETGIAVLSGTRCFARFRAGALTAVIFVSLILGAVLAAVLIEKIVQGLFTRQAQLAAFLTLPVPLPLAALISFVTQLLLFLAHTAKLIESAAHFLSVRIGLMRPRSSQIFENILQMFEHFLGARAVTGTQHVLHLVEHRLQFLGADRAAFALQRCGVVLIVFLALPRREFLQELVHRGAQIFAQLAYFILWRVALEGIAQLLFGGA